MRPDYFAATHRPRGYRPTRKWRFVVRKLKGWHNAWRQQTPQERTEARIVARYTAVARKLRGKLAYFKRELSLTYHDDREPPAKGYTEYQWELRLGEVRAQLRENIARDQLELGAALREVYLAKRGRVHYARYH